jgi:ABC-2 type transport system ATP-binding protein
MQIARALIGDPAVLILDEPASGLDPEGTDVLFGELRARARHGAVVLVSSHDLHSVESFADDILLLEAGTVVAHSPVQEFLARGEEVVGVEVDLDAPPDGALRALLAGRLVELSIDGSHVAGRLKPGTTTAGFLRMVLSAAEVADFKQRTASLRDVYLARSPGAGPSGRDAS